MARLQRRLIELGWLTGDADGYYGDDTAEAVRAYQYQIAQVQDGSADVTLQQRLFADDARANVVYTPLAQGARGQEVLAIQKRLIDLGYLDNTEANTDGDYGPTLAGAVQQLKADIQQRMMETSDERLLDILFTASQYLDDQADPDFQNFLFSDNALMFNKNPMYPY